MIPDAACSTCIVVDRNTGAMLSRGVRYPLAYGGTIEIVQTFLPTFTRLGGVLVRIDAPGQYGVFQRLPALANQSLGYLFVNFPPLDIWRMYERQWSRKPGMNYIAYHPPWWQWGVVAPSWPWRKPRRRPKLYGGGRRREGGRR